MTRKRICIVNFLTHYDWRMARQLPALVKEYDVTIVGFKDIFEPIDGIEWKFIEVKRSPLSKIWDRAMMMLGKVFPAAYDIWYWRRQRYRDGMAAALAVNADAYQADDWASLPVAVEAAKRNGAKVVYDAYEYWTLEGENIPRWKTFFSPLIKHIENRYIPQVDKMVTVSPPFVERYGKEYNIEPVLITNAPPSEPIPAFKPTDAEHIRLVNHGSAVPERYLERMIEAMAYTDERFTLDCIFLPTTSGYIESLQALAQRVAPNRITFQPPVPKSDVLTRISEYDIGIFIIPPLSWSYYNTLPNRFFDFIAAGLAVCVSPSPAMASMVQQYGNGVVTPTSEAADIGAALNRLTAQDIDAMKQASRQIAGMLTAEIENQKWIPLYNGLFHDA